MDRNYAANAVDQILPGSLSARRAWIEIVMQEIAQQRKQSLSARRAWIEMLTDDVSAGGKIVALRKESVDRNTNDEIFAVDCRKVALRKESVDRNP